MVKVPRFALCALLLLPWPVHAGEDLMEAPAQLRGFPQGAVTITHGERRDRFRVWTADTDARKEQGLMFVRRMPKDRGMWFPQSVATVVVLWMKNTYLPLDMVFVGEHDEIVGIASNTTPLSPNMIASPGPVIAVLELNAGETARRGIRVGDHVTQERRTAASRPPDAAAPIS
jgi:hypothetical protein